jgi:glucokinase
MSEPLILGLDVGGTKVAAGLVDPRGQIITRLRRPMVAHKSAEDGLAAVLRAAEQALASPAARESQITAAGISTPGYVDPASGTVIRATNLPCWQNFPLAERVSAALHLPVRLDNDGNAAALAEALWGAGVGYTSVFYVTLGTGIGSGFVVNGRVHHGRTGGAGEGGHMTIDLRGPRCLCGKRGCVEMFCAGPAIAKRAHTKLTAHRRHRGKRRPRSLLHVPRGSDITAEMVGKAALEGDALAVEVLEEVADYFAIWLGGIIDLLEPHVIVIGGGLGHLMASFFGRMRERLAVWSINPRSAEIPIVSAMYGAVSGIAGAAALCLDIG